MSKVVLDGKYLRVGGVKLPLLSGEFHFWRNNKCWWRRILSEIKKAGFDLISTYVCWDFQEVSPGRYDFSGETNEQRDLDGFLSLCKEMGLYVILRPGPYIGSEYPHWGIPEHAAPYYRLHPEFLKKARHYVSAICATIRPHLASNGGPVVLVQSDNEIDLMMGLYNATDTFLFFKREYFDQAIGDGKVDDHGTYRNWLRRTYRTIEKLNSAWGTTYRAFKNVDFFINWPSSLGERQRLLDSNEYFDWASTEYLRIVTAWFREEEISVPLYTNTYGNPQPMNIPEMQKVVDLVGTDHYAPNMVPVDSLRSMGLALRRSCAQTPFTYIPEFMSGIVSLWTNSFGFGMIAPEHHRYMGLAAMLFGCQGWNWYMLVEREEWYYSPINERGEVREQYWRHFQAFVRIWRKLDWPAFEKVSSCALFWYRPHHYLSKSEPWRPAVPEGLQEIFILPRRRSTNFDHAIDALFGADIDFDVYDPYGAYNKLSREQPILYAGLNFIEPRVEEQLLAHAEAGGVVVFFGSYPVEFSDGKSSKLSRLLPPLKTSLTWGGALELVFEKGRVVAHTEALNFYDQGKLRDAKPILGGGGMCGCVVRHGRGRLLLLGLNPGKQLLQIVLDILKVREPCRSETDGVLSSVWRKGKEVAIVLLNTNQEDCTAALSIDIDRLGIKPKDKLSVSNLLDDKKQKVSGEHLAQLTVSLEGRNGCVLSIAKSV